MPPAVLEPVDLELVGETAAIGDASARNRGRLVLQGAMVEAVAAASGLRVVDLLKVCSAAGVKVSERRRDAMLAALGEHAARVALRDAHTSQHGAVGGSQLASEADLDRDGRQ